MGQHVLTALSCVAWTPLGYGACTPSRRPRSRAVGLGWGQAGSGHLSREETYHTAAQFDWDRWFSEVYCFCVSVKQRGGP